MPVRDILLQLNSYPEPTPSWAVDSAAYMAQRLSARLSVGLCEVQLPDLSGYFPQLIARSATAVEEENRQSAHNAAALRRKFQAAVPSEQAGETIVIDCPALATAWQLAARARAYDLTIVPFYGHRETRAIAETLIFESARPVLLLPPEGMAGHRFDEVVIAWDGSRTATRALAAATSLCALASSVTVVTVTNDKEFTGTAPAADVVRHLSRHGIEAMELEAELEGADAGDALNGYCRRVGADLLVMGAYGHTRVREFVLGGATRTVLNGPHLPILLAH
jgi:nucleotide-binding universal stress UspA family protein